MAGTDYWASFVAALARSRPAASATGGGATGGTRHRRRRAEAAERRAGIFYVSPCERYTFAHPQETGHTTCPFHAVWCCGGWHTERQRKEAVRALRPLRREGRVELFRDAAMMQRRGLFAAGSAAKRGAEG